MIHEIKPIETEYKGYRFRSRLEARWAVFFDEIGAKWEYEPEGFALKDGTMYLPDFLVHGVRGRGCDEKGDIYVEVKGVLTQDDLHKVELFPFQIIIFGQIPEAEWREGYWANGEHYAYWHFDYGKDENEYFYNLQFSEGDDYWTEPKAGDGGGLVLDYPDNPYGYVDDKLTEQSYKKARQARFEHGEHGAITRKKHSRKDYSPDDDYHKFFDFLMDNGLQQSVVDDFKNIDKHRADPNYQRLLMLDMYRKYGFKPSGTMPHERELRVYYSESTDYWRDHPGELDKRMYEIFGERK